MRFSKMQGLGNDFIVIDAINQSFQLTPQQIKTLSNRKLGIGFDQCLVVEPARSAKADFFYRIFNADGSEVGQCGNGARCVGRFIKEKGLSDKEYVLLETITTKIKTKLHESKEMSIWLAPPILCPDGIPMKGFIRQEVYTLTFNDETLSFHALNIGNPHAIFFMPENKNINLDSLGEFLNQHEAFPDGINVNVVRKKTDKQLLLETYERGVGRTLACGSGATATFCAGRLFHHVSASARVCQPGGELSFFWENKTDMIEMTGEALPVFEGEIDL